MMSNRMLCANRWHLKFTRNFIKSTAMAKPGVPLRRYIKGLLFGATAGSIIYDGFNDFQVAGGASRFLRSLKIAATISVDYLWNLHGLATGSESYDMVRRKNIQQILQNYM